MQLLKRTHTGLTTVNESTTFFGCAFRVQDGDSALLIASDQRTTVNGSPVTLGIHELSHKDEVLLANGERLFFSNEKLPTYFDAAPDTGHELRCMRSKMIIAPGTPAVQCSCNSWYLASAEHNCWEYRIPGDDTEPTCLSCGRPATLDGRLLWTPDVDAEEGDE